MGIVGWQLSARWATATCDRPSEQTSTSERPRHDPHNGARPEPDRSWAEGSTNPLRGHYRTRRPRRQNQAPPRSLRSSRKQTRTVRSTPSCHRRSRPRRGGTRAEHRAGHRGRRQPRSAAPRPPPRTCLVGRRRRRLPGRTRRLPRRRRLRVVSGGGARGGRAAARRGRRPARPGGRLRAGAVRPLAGRAGRRAGRGRSVRRHAAPRPRPATPASGLDVPLVQANAEELPFRVRQFRRGVLGFWRGALRGGSRTPCCARWPGCCGRAAVGVRGDSPDAVGIPGRPGPEG